MTLLKLTKLKLKLEAPFVSTLPSLKVLCLAFVESDAKSPGNLISGCPIIEDLELRYIFENLDFDVSKTLKNLTLNSSYSTFIGSSKQWLEGLISRLPLLEKFNCSLKYVDFHNISICSHSLKSLSITRYDYASDPIFTEASITIPNLTFFDFSCFLKSVVLIEAPNLSEAKLPLKHMYPNKASFNDLIHFLSNLNDLKKLELSI